MDPLWSFLILFDSNKAVTAFSLLPPATFSLISPFTSFLNSTIAPHLENASVWAEPANQALMFCETLTKRPSTKQYSLEITPFLKSPWGEGQVKVAAIPKMSKQPFYFLFMTVYSHTGNSYIWQEPLQRLFSREVWLIRSTCISPVGTQSLTYT